MSFFYAAAHAGCFVIGNQMLKAISFPAWPLPTLVAFAEEIG
jgi:hypothetical protein